MNSHFIINFEDPPADYFPLPFEPREAAGRAGGVQFTDRPLRHGEHSGKVFWDVYINAVIQKVLADPRSHDGDRLWSGGILLYFPAGKYHLNNNLYIYDTNPGSPHYGQCWSNVNVRGDDTSTKFLAEGACTAIYMTGYCGAGRLESAQGACMRDFWSQGLDICFGVYDEDLERFHGRPPVDPQMTHGIWSFYVDKLYVHSGGVRIKRLSSDISITNCTFDYGKNSIEILDHVYSVTIQNNHFWNQGARVRIVHSTERFDWKPFFEAKRLSQREGYARGGMILIVGNRDNSPGTSKFPEGEGAFHIENCDEVVFTGNYSQDTRQPIDIPAGQDENYGGRILPEANFCNGSAFTARNCRYVNLSNNIFGGYWPAGRGVVRFDKTSYSTISNNIFTPGGGMNRELAQLSPEALAKLPESYAVEVTESCLGVQVQGNVVETVGAFKERKEPTR